MAESVFGRAAGSPASAGKVVAQARSQHRARSQRSLRFVVLLAVSLGAFLFWHRQSDGALRRNQEKWFGPTGGFRPLATCR